MELGAGLVHLQPIASGLFDALTDVGLDRLPPVIGSYEPQYRQPFGHDHVVVARGLWIDRPLDVVALQRELSRPVMLNSGLPRRQHLQRAS